MTAVALDEEFDVPGALGHMKRAPGVFHWMWLASTVVTTVVILVATNHTIKLLRIALRMREDQKKVFVPVLGQVYIKIFLFFPLISILSWLSLLLLRFAILFHLVLHIYEAACLLWFWELMTDLLGGPENAFQVLHLATSLSPKAVQRLIRATSLFNSDITPTSITHDDVASNETIGTYLLNNNFLQEAESVLDSTSRRLSEPTVQRSFRSFLLFPRRGCWNCFLRKRHYAARQGHDVQDDICGNTTNTETNSVNTLICSRSTDHNATWDDSKKKIHVFESSDIAYTISHTETIFQPNLVTYDGRCGTWSDHCLPNVVESPNSGCRRSSEKSSQYRSTLEEQNISIRLPVEAQTTSVGPSSQCSGTPGSAHDQYQQTAESTTSQELPEISDRISVSAQGLKTSQNFVSNDDTTHPIVRFSHSKGRRLRARHLRRVIGQFFESDSSFTDADILAWNCYLRTVRFGPYNVLGITHSQCHSQDKKRGRSFKKNDLRLSFHLVGQYVICATVSALSRVLSQRLVFIFQALGLTSLLVAMYGLLILFRATIRIIPREECHLEWKFAAIKLAVFVIKGSEVLLRYAPIVIGYELPYGKTVMGLAWGSLLTNIACLPIILVSVLAYPSKDLSRRYSSFQESRAGMLVSLLTSLVLFQPHSASHLNTEEDAVEDIIIKIREYTPTGRHSTTGSV